MKSVLLVIDVQNDFIDGALGSKEAAASLPNVIEKIEKFNGQVIFTRDTHEENYLSTQEGKNLPVKHCIKNTDGWQIVKKADEYRIKNNCMVFDKVTFGSTECAEYIKKQFESGEIDKVTLIGYCTDICVVSNALILKATCPELELHVDSSCCAGVTPEKHKAALETMASCQIIID